MQPHTLRKPHQYAQAEPADLAILDLGYTLARTRGETLLFNDDDLAQTDQSTRRMISAIAVVTKRLIFYDVRWRATVDEDGHYSFAVPL